MFSIHATCGCNTGKIRKKNEDNFFFAEQYLPENNNGLKESIVYENILSEGFFTAIFDGMGGENFGETASFVAAKKTEQLQKENNDYGINKHDYLDVFAKKLDKAVVEAQQQMFTSRMGATMVCLLYSDKCMYFCNVGDSRAYRFRKKELKQLSCDHIAKRQGTEKRKAPITQFLGFGSEDIEIVPFIEKSEIENNDVYLLCSDGLTDMLTDSEIQDILCKHIKTTDSVETLINTAIEHGGRDNITVIICKVTEEEIKNE